MRKICHYGSRFRIIKYAIRKYKILSMVKHKDTWLWRTAHWSSTVSNWMKNAGRILPLTKDVTSSILKLLNRYLHIMGTYFFNTAWSIKGCPLSKVHNLFRVLPHNYMYGRQPWIISLNSIFGPNFGTDFTRDTHPPHVQPFQSITFSCRLKMSYRKFIYSCITNIVITFIFMKTLKLHLEPEN